MKAVHKHTLGHEYEYEPQYGLPEALPAGERLLWQGAPDWRALALEAFHVRKLALYFGAVLALRAAFTIADGGGPSDVLSGWAWLAPLAVLAVGTMALMARLTARATAYTITDKRLVMRIGIVLTITYNLPLTRIAAAGLLVRKGGNGDIPLTLGKGERIALLQLWPHARAWHVREPQPMLRCLPDAARVGRTLHDAWAAANGLGAAAPAIEAAPAPQAPSSSRNSPALAGAHAA